MVFLVVFEIVGMVNFELVFVKIERIKKRRLRLCFNFFFNRKMIRGFFFFGGGFFRICWELIFV